MQTTQTAELRAGAQLAQGRRPFRLTHLQKRNLWGFAFAVPALCLFALSTIVGYIGAGIYDRARTAK